MDKMAARNGPEKMGKWRKIMEKTIFSIIMEKKWGKAVNLEWGKGMGKNHA